MIYTAASNELNRQWTELSRALKAIPGVGSGHCGLTPDHVKFSPEYRAAKRAVDQAFATLREFNRRHAKQLRAEQAR